MAEKVASETYEGAAYCRRSQRKEEKDAEKESKRCNFTNIYSHGLKQSPINQLELVDTLV